MFHDSLEASCRRSNTCLCVGLDIDWREMSAWFPPDSFDLIEFGRRLVQATRRHTCAYKFNHAFFAAHGLENDLAQIIWYVKDTCPEIPVILDAKRGDIGNTASRYAEEAFNRYMVDAVTVNPYLGWDTVEPFLRFRDKGIVLLSRTSNAGSAWIQEQGQEQPVYLRVAERVAREANPNLLLVVGATQLDALKRVRQIAKHTTLLIPGIGAQGGDLNEVLRLARRSDGLGVIINCSRSIIMLEEHEDYFARVEESAFTLSRSMRIESIC